MALTKQVHIYSFDTGDFYSNHERSLHSKIYNLKYEKEMLIQKIEIMKENGCSEDDIELMEDIKSYKTKLISQTKDKLLALLERKANSNITSKHKLIRKLRPEALNPRKVVSVFESANTRQLGMATDQLSLEMVIIQVYYFDIIKDLIYNGFELNGEKYVYFTSSAGQIRTKKCVFVKESTYNRLEKTLLCGLTIDTINEKGGNNVNKTLAYLALGNSATDEWQRFDIDRVIVVDDYENLVHGTYDFVDDTTYQVKRVTGDVPITQTDGIGMMLPSVSEYNFMFRAPWIKGLLGVFDFVRFIQEYNLSPIVKDIYGKEHDIIAEDINVILCKSQFKMYKFYDSWQQYKDYFKEYNCTAGICNVEEPFIKNAKINYQMLQTLTEATDDDIQAIAQKSIDKVSNICSSIESLYEIFGVTDWNHNPTWHQLALKAYPNLLSDIYEKDTIRSLKDSLVKKYRSGRLEVNGKYTFILPDLYAFCQHLFNYKTDDIGLLKGEEVYCSLFPDAKKLDCLRSPHLYKEHAVRQNVCDKEKSKWFCTRALYTSCYDMISKILQFDDL